MKDKYKTILIFGPPGSGKSTQAKLLDTDKFFYVSTGELLRKLEGNSVFKNSDLGKKIAEIMASGKLIPDDLIFALFKKSLNEDIKNGLFDPAKQILVLDGIPRDAAQVKMADVLFDVIQIVDINIPDDTILIDRLSKRAKDEKRADDKEIIVIKERLEVYRAKTFEILSCYPEKLITRIDGSGTVEEIHRSMDQKLNEW